MAWESSQFERAVSDIFGFHALQLGLPYLDALRANRMPHKWIAQLADDSIDHCVEQTTDDSVHEINARGVAPQTSACDAQVHDMPRAALALDGRALPFADQSLDLILLPHTLELSPDPHATLREVERVLVPEGKIIISGLNPMSLWGFHQKRVNAYRRLGFNSEFLPRSGEFIGYWRLRDWLKLLSFEVEGGRFGCYRPAFTTSTWLNRFAWMDNAGDRWWPILGSVYFLVAVKRVRAMRLLSPAWKRPRQRAVVVPSVNSSSIGGAKQKNNYE